MRWSPFLLSASLLLFITLHACATAGGFDRSGSDATSRVYPVSETQAREIVKTVFLWEGADAVKESHKKNYIVASIGTGMFSYDAAMCAWLDSVDDENTMITVATKRKDLSKATTFTQATFYWRFSQAVEIVTAGNPLPASPPN